MIIVLVMLVSSIIFCMLLKTKKTVLAKLSIDVRDAIAFSVFAILMVGSFVAIKKFIGISNENINYLSIILQIALAYLVTRPIADCKPNERIRINKKSEVDNNEMTDIVRESNNEDINRAS